MAYIRKQTITINAAPEAVYDYISDLSRHPEWAHEAMTMDAPAGPAPAGTKFQSHVQFFGKVPGEGVVVEAQRPGRFVMDCKDTAGLHRWSFVLKPEAGGTHLDYTQERISAPFFVKFGQATFFYPLIGKKMISSSLEKIKANLEGAKTAAAG